MTKEEAIDIIKTAVSEVEWEYPMEYSAAFDVAAECIQKCINLEKCSCSNCEFGVPRGRLWECFNTEVNINSCNSDKFWCCKWSKKY